MVNCIVVIFLGRSPILFLFDRIPRWPLCMEHRRRCQGNSKFNYTLMYYFFQGMAAFQMCMAPNPTVRLSLLFQIFLWFKILFYSKDISNQFTEEFTFMNDIQGMDPPEEVQWNPSQVQFVFKSLNTNLSWKLKVKFRSFFNGLFTFKVMEMEVFPMDMEVNPMVIDHI